MPDIKLTLDQVEELARDALTRAGASQTAASSVAASTRAAERDGIRSHGLPYVPIYAEHVRCGKVDGQAEPVLSQPKPGIVKVDAATGFAHPAIDYGLPALFVAAKSQGIAMLAINRSYNCGVLAYHAERIADAGLLGLCFTNAPASIAPIGGKKPVVGTNPFALGVPGPDGPAFVLDQSASVIAKSEISLRARLGEKIDPSWAFDADGHPTDDPAAALKGSMAPSGGYKGFGIGLTVEIFAAAISGALLGKDASPFAGTAGGPPMTGQCFLAIDATASSGAIFAQRVEQLAAAIESQDGARLPGSRRRLARGQIEAEGVTIDQALFDKIKNA